MEAVAEHRLVGGFLREGRYNPSARETFVRAGGFCRVHAWRLHAAAQAESTGAGIADVYGALVERDVQWIDQTFKRLGKRRWRRRIARDFRRPFSCPVCARLARARESHGYFLAQLLADERARATFASGDGLCTVHLEIAVRQAARADKRGDVASFLLGDARERLVSLRHELAEYDRKRDYRHADERRGTEQGSWTEVIRRYVGDPSPRARGRGRRNEAPDGCGPASGKPNVTEMP